MKSVAKAQAKRLGTLVTAGSMAASGEAVAKKRRFTSKVSPFFASLMEDLGQESVQARQWVYLVTVSRVLGGSTSGTYFRNLEQLQKVQLAEMVRDALDNPVESGSVGGRPRVRTGLVADIIVVVKEAHADGSAHFHVVLKLHSPMRFRLAKRTLQERHHLPSHWSCTHSQLWSALRYVQVASPTKPSIDTEPFVWTSDGRTLDMVELSRVPFTAVAWRERREKAEAKAAIEQKKSPNFNKAGFLRVGPVQAFAHQCVASGVCPGPWLARLTAVRQQASAPVGRIHRGCARMGGGKVGCWLRKDD